MTSAGVGEWVTRSSTTTPLGETPVLGSPGTSLTTGDGGDGGSTWRGRDDVLLATPVPLVRSCHSADVLGPGRSRPSTRRVERRNREWPGIQRRRTTKGSVPCGSDFRESRGQSGTLSRSTKSATRDGKWGRTGVARAVRPDETPTGRSPRYRRRNGRTGVGGHRRVWSSKRHREGLGGEGVNSGEESCHVGAQRRGL